MAIAQNLPHSFNPLTWIRRLFAIKSLRRKLFSAHLRSCMSPGDPYHLTIPVDRDARLYSATSSVTIKLASKSKLQSLLR